MAGSQRQDSKTDERNLDHIRLEESSPFEWYRAEITSMQETLRVCGAESQAQALERCLLLFEQALDRLMRWSVRYADASRITGWAIGTIRNKVASGDLTKIRGIDGAPRVLVTELLGGSEETPPAVVALAQEAVMGDGRPARGYLSICKGA